MNLLKFFGILACLQIAACQSPDSTKSKTATTDPNSANSSVYQRLDVQQFQLKLSSENKPQLVDVRTPDEYIQGNIEGSVNLNFYDSDFEKKLSQLDKKKTIFVYCQSGGRSKKTAKLLQQLGFKEIYELKVGYSGWEH